MLDITEEVFIHHRSFTENHSRLAQHAGFHLSHFCLIQCSLGRSSNEIALWVLPDAQDAHTTEYRSIYLGLSSRARRLRFHISIV